MIEFESVSKTFAGGTHAVQDLSLTIPSDKITVIVGPSGCGKTTTLRMINRMLEPSKGRITWDGKPLKSQRKTSLRRQMGYVIQSGGLFPHRTVVENIGTVPGLLGWDKSKTRKRSMELLANVGLDRGMAERFPGQLSGGQQQRVGVARALAADPLVMLMDEPFSAVDPVVRTELHEFFLGLQRQISKTIVLITHDIDEAIKLGDQVAILRVGGRLAQFGPPQELLDEPADAFVEGFVGRDRGYRSLNFLPAAGLRLGEVAVIREAASGSGDGPTLVLDGDARPVGWVDEQRAGLVHPIGGTFVREADTLRSALDSALTSPYAIAVAVEPDTGRYAGVVTADEILDQVRERRSGSPESITLQDAEAREQQSAEAQSAVTSAYAQLDDAQNPSSEDAAAGEPVADEPVRDEAVPDGPDPDVERDLGPGGATAVDAEGLGDRSDDSGDRETETAEPETAEPEHRETGSAEPAGRETATDGLEQPAEAEDVRASDVPEDDQPTSVRGMPVVEGEAAAASTGEAVEPDQTPAADDARSEPGWRPSGLYRTPRSLSPDEPEQRG